MIVGAMEFVEALEKMSRVDLRRGVAQAISFVQEDARSNCPVHDGELRGSIYTDTEDQGDIVRRLRKSTTSSISTRQKAVSINVPDRLHSHSSIRP